MAIAIETKFSGPTNTRGSRYVASTCNGHRLSLEADYSLDSEGNHMRVACALAEKQGWLKRSRLVGGGTKKGYAWVLIDKVFVQRDQVGVEVASIVAGD